MLADDMAAAAKASPQEVNVMTLVEALAEDIRQDVFDGNDTNDNASGSGLQVGLCSAAPSCSPPSGCAEGACRTLCDLYRGTLRVLLSQAMSRVVQTEKLNQTGLKLPDFAAVIRAVNQNDDVDSSVVGSVTVWDLKKDDKVAEWVAGGHLRAIAWAPSAALATAGDDGVKVWRIDGPSVTEVPDVSIPDASRAVAFSVDGTELLAGFDGEHPSVKRVRMPSTK